MPLKLQISFLQLEFEISPIITGQIELNSPITSDFFYHLPPQRSAFVDRPSSSFRTFSFLFFLHFRWTIPLIFSISSFISSRRLFSFPASFSLTGKLTDTFWSDTVKTKPFWFIYLFIFIYLFVCLFVCLFCPSPEKPVLRPERMKEESESTIHGPLPIKIICNLFLVQSVTWEQQIKNFRSVGAN